MTNTWGTMAELTDKQIQEEERFLKGLPRMNWGAFFMPGIWGPAHGFWICLLFYPLWLLADNLTFNAYLNPEPSWIALSVIALAFTIGVTIAFALISQPLAAHRAADKGISRQHYLKRERVWAIVCLILAIVALVWATYYNLNIRVEV